jgi:flagellar basal-body rod protein FlgB
MRSGAPAPVQVKGSSMIDFEGGLGFTQRVLDSVAVRYRVIQHNLANLSTPGFKRYYVSFEEELRKAAKSGDDLAEVYPVVRRDNSGPMDQNNVSSTDELALLQKVELMHELFSRRAGGYFSHINKAIYGR